MTKSKISHKSIVLQRLTLTLIEPHIIRMKIKEGETVDVDDMILARINNLELSEGKMYCVLLDASEGFFSATPEVRQLTASEEFSIHRHAVAYLVGSLAIKLAGNFFIQFHKPVKPTRIFSDEKEAIAWLRSFLK